VHLSDYAIRRLLSETYGAYLGATGILRRYFQMITVCRAQRRVPGTDNYVESTRLFTEEALARSKTLERIPGTDVEIDKSRLLPEGWTERHSVP
jgi:hypothetical protein